MKNLLILTVLFVAFAINSGCKKEEKKEETPVETTKYNFNFKLNGTQYDVNAIVRVLVNNRYSIHWDTSMVGVFTNIDLDLFSNIPGTYTVTDSPTQPNHAYFKLNEQINSVQTEYTGTSGTVVLTEVLDNKWTGTFSLKATETFSGTEYNITDGKFKAVLQQ